MTCCCLKGRQWGRLVPTTHFCDKKPWPGHVGRVRPWEILLRLFGPAFGHSRLWPVNGTISSHQRLQKQQEPSKVRKRRGQLRWRDEQLERQALQPPQYCWPDSYRGVETDPSWAGHCHLIHFRKCGQRRTQGAPSKVLRRVTHQMVGKPQVWSLTQQFSVCFVNMDLPRNFSLGDKKVCTLVAKKAFYPRLPFHFFTITESSLRFWPTEPIFQPNWAKFFA